MTGPEVVTDEDQPGGAPAARRPWYRPTGKRIAFTVLLSALLGIGLGQLYLATDGDQRMPARQTASGQTGLVTEFPVTDRGQPVAVDGTTLTDDLLALTDLRGQVVVLNVWGSWCPPCREEAPVLATVSTEYADRGVSFVGINVRDNRAAAVAFERRYDITYPSIEDQGGRALLALNQYVPANAVPVTLVLDRQGRVAARVLGAVEAGTLTALLDTVLTEPGQGNLRGPSG